ncbi:MAG: ribosomal protein S18-alanine N-acetyltransferase [Bacillota bacterium]|nr:ribosomal protein S18-alanine N-acetyltransferase [Bacillota bacterium]
MDLPITVSPMEMHDIGKVAALEQVSFREPWPAESFITELNTNRLARYLVARLGEKVIGYIGCWIIIDEVHLTTLAVAKEYQRRGIATLLLKALFDTVMPHQPRSFTLEVRPSNRAARQFYEKHGFAVCGRRLHYYSDEDALIMTKPLRGGKRRNKREGGARGGN